MEIAMRRIRKILAAGANVVLTTKGIDDFCLKAFVDAGCIACRRVPSDDMKRIAKATGARVVVNLGDEDGGEAFEAEWLGEAESVFEERVSDDDMVFITGTKTARCAPACVRCRSHAARRAHARCYDRHLTVLRRRPSSCATGSRVQRRLQSTFGCLHALHSSPPAVPALLLSPLAKHSLSQLCGLARDL